MLKIITDKKQIERLHNKFSNTLSEVFTQEFECTVGRPYGSFTDTVRYSPRLNMWISQHQYPNRLWNGFGVGRPSTTKSNSINGEINFPYEGISRSIAGVLAREENGNILILHRGIIGGGTSGIGKNYFLEKFQGDFVYAIDGDKTTKFCVVGELTSADLPELVAVFINDIYRIKNLKKSGIPNFSSFSTFSYTKETAGQSVTENNEPRIINRTHGIIVDALEKKLKEKGHKVANDRNRDLFIYRRGKVTTLFEVKTMSSTQCLYSAIGQLLLYSIPLENNVSLFAVLPQKLSSEVEERFASLGIGLIYFERNKDEVSFTGLSEL